LALLAFLLPLVVKGFPLIIISVSLIGIIYFLMAYQKLGKPKKNYLLLPYNLLIEGFTNILKKKNAMFYMVILFFVYCVSIFYSDDLKTAGQKIILKSSYLYFPLIFALTKWDKKKLIRVLDFFLAGCFFQVVISFFDAYMDAGFRYDSAEFSYVKLSYNLHPSYAALLINIGFIFNSLRIIQLLKEEVKTYFVFFRIILLASFSLFILMLSSKAGLICFVLSFLVIVGYAFFCFKSVKTLFFGGICLIILVGGGVTFLGGTTKSKFKELIHSMKNRNIERNKSKVTTSSQTRIVLWENSLSAIKKSFVFGFGVGDGKLNLQNELELNKETYVFSRNYNSHNQFFETALSTGFVGFIFLVIILIKGTFMKSGSFGIISILLGMILIINLSFESMMEKQIGSITITWLICLLVSAKDIFRTAFKYP
jgi:O-antigen ligase